MRRRGLDVLYVSPLARPAVLKPEDLSSDIATERVLVQAVSRLLLLDEPFEGVAPALSRRLAEVIGMLRGKDVAVLIAQSDLNHTIRLLDREYLIERGANR